MSSSTLSIGSETKQIREPSINDLSSLERVLVSFAAGGVAGAAAKTSIAPLDRCKISFQIGQEPYSTKAAYRYLTNVYKTQGFLALWRGNSATMARILPYAAIQFSSHEQFKRMFGVNNIQRGEVVKDVELRRFMAGSLAGVTSQTLTYPLDLARARMAVTTDQQFSSLNRVFRKTYQKEGIHGFYRGYVPTVLGVIPYAGASFFTYETLKHWYSDYWPDSKPGAFERLLFGACSGVCGQSLSYPLDIVRRRMQTAVITGRLYRTVPETIASIAREEGIIKGFFKGLSMNWIKGPVAVGISFATYDSMKDFLAGFFTSRRR